MPPEVVISVNILLTFNSDNLDDLEQGVYWELLIDCGNIRMRLTPSFLTLCWRMEVPKV